MKMEDKYTNKSCWSWKDSIVIVDRAREDCEHCTSGECHRRIALLLSITQPNLVDRQQNEIDKWQKKIKEARILAKKYQTPIITARQKDRKDG